MQQFSFSIVLLNVVTKQCNKLITNYIIMSNELIKV